MFSIRSLTRHLHWRLPSPPTREQALEFAKAAAPWLGMAVALWLLFAPEQITYFKAAFNPNRFSDDTRIQLFHFYHYGDPALFANDVIGKYHSDGTGDFFRLVYIIGAKVSDPMTLSRVLPIVLLIAALGGMAVAGRNLAGKPGAFLAVALCAGAAVMHSRLVGGLPRGFAYPFLAWCVAALTGGWVRAFAVLMVVGAGFYPIPAVLGGITLALWLLVMPAVDRGVASGWSLRRRVIFLAITAAATGLVILPFALRMRPHGETIKPSMIQEFPEAGPGGRSGPLDRAPFPPFFDAAASLVARSAVSPANRGLVPSVAKSARSTKKLDAGLRSAFAWIVALGLIRVGFASAAVRRLAAFAVATCIGYVVANAVTPTLVVPQRYAQFAIPILVPLAIIAGLRGLYPRRLGPDGSQTPAQRRWTLGFMVAVGTLVLLVFGGAGPRPRKDDVTLRKPDKPLYAAIRKLPKNVLVAGWPREVMNQVPLATKRTPFLTQQTHMPYHSKMTLVMRERMKALIQAYFATRNGPLIELREKFGVTHLVVEWSHFRGEPPKYFKPFNPDIQRALRSAEGREFAVERAAETAAVFSDEKYALLDLSRLRPGAKARARVLSP